MKITELLNIDAIDLQPHVSSKQEAIEHMVDLLDQTGCLNDKEKYKESVLQREQQSTTGIGDGVAIPHGQSEGVAQAALGAMVVKEGLDFQALDGQPTYLFFMIAAPKEAGGVHLQALAKLSTLLMDESFRQALIQAPSKEAFKQLIDEKENEKTEVKQQVHPDVLAVTACPTGIAHTFMAAEALNQAGEKLNISIKVETNGQEGVKNGLTQDDIDHCKAIIVAADKKVEMARFEGKNVIQVPVKDGISKAEELVKKAMNQEGVIYHHGQNEKEKINPIRIFYKHLMNGVSHDLPFAVAGGVLYGVLHLCQNALANSTLLSVLAMIYQLLMLMIIPVLSGYIADSIADRPAMVSGFMGGLIVCQGMAVNTIPTWNGTFVPSLFVGIIAGFIAGYFSLLLKKLLSYLPSCLKGIEASLLHPVISTGVVMLVMIFLNPYLYYVHNGILNLVYQFEINTPTKILFGAVLGMMMAIDMGGPINKTAYVFGIGMIINHDYTTMAAIMAGGMVPPLVIALTATLKKNKWSGRRKEALMNYINGISFISEGAIPFMQENPQTVLTACCIGAAITGGLSMYFNCGIASPHGGLFLIWMVDYPLQYLISILAGTVIGSLLLLVLKSKKENS